ncbi:MAG: hypothetical protein A2167_00070 [Planctomycetes bacterium RBG_13_46_10]|nr:MAG: hypothetical protein A2167_00070 [Planctomycetes bacterium RBG_13_46_10]
MRLFLLCRNYYVKQNRFYLIVKLIKLVLELSEIGRIHPLLTGSCLDVPPNIVTIRVIENYMQKRCQQKRL